jgi:ribonuclease P protein subunit RPR2
MQVKTLARERIQILWEKSREVAGERPELAKKWMQQARNIAQRARIKLPRHMSRRLCKNCGAFFVPSKNCRVRMRQNREKHLAVTCLECGAIRRFPARGKT